MAALDSRPLLDGGGGWGVTTIETRVRRLEGRARPRPAPDPRLAALVARLDGGEPIDACSDDDLGYLIAAGASAGDMTTLTDGELLAILAASDCVRHRKRAQDAHTATLREM